MVSVSTPFGLYWNQWTQVTLQTLTFPLELVITCQYKGIVIVVYGVASLTAGLSQEPEMNDQHAHVYVVREIAIEWTPHETKKATLHSTGLCSVGRCPIYPICPQRLLPLPHLRCNAKWVMTTTFVYASCWEKVHDVRFPRLDQISCIRQFQ